MGAEFEDNWLSHLYYPIKSGKCGICGELHAVEECTLIEGFTDYVPDTPSPSYARLTLPEGMEVRELSDGTKTVVAIKSFSKGLKFGPFVAKTSTLIDVRIEFPIKVFLSEEESVYLETYEEIFCNWMCLVLPASCLEEQNLICFQIKTSIYFCSLREVKEGEELRVWYAPYYADKMGVRAHPRPPDLIHSSDEEFQEIFESLQSGIEMQDNLYVPKVKKRRRQPKKLVLGENYYREVPPSDVLPGELLGAARRAEWECPTCGQVELNVAAYARHLMTHCAPPRRPSYCCPHCNRNFRKDGHRRQMHLETCRRKKLKELTLSESNQQNQSATSESIQGNKNDLPLDSSTWNESVKCEKPIESNVNNNNQIFAAHSSGILVKKEYPETILNCKVSPENDKSDKTISNKHNNGWSVEPETPLGMDLAETAQLACSDVSSKTNEDKSGKALGLLQNSKEIIDENILVKSHLDTPILDLSDDIDFRLTKSLDEMMDDHSNIEVSLSFSKNKSLDIFGGVETSLLASEVPSDNLSLESNPLYFTSCNDMTDEERNRIVENFLRESDDKFFSSDYDMTDGCVSDNPDTQPKGDQEEERGKIKRKRSKTDGEFKCDICKKGFDKPFYLYRHLRKHSGEFRCNTCFMVFARKENLQNHRLSCPNQADSQDAVRRVRMSCKFCRLQFHSLSSLQEHMEAHYCPGDTWECTCKETSNSSDHFLTHKCALSKPFKSCTKCRIKFKSVKDFVEHRSHPILNIAKTRHRPVLCEVCGVFSQTATGARLHRLTHDEKTHTCSVCGKSFVRLSLLQEHSKKHENLSWECPVCSKKFTTEKLCLKHQKNTHIEPSFTCSYCNKTFRQKVNFKRHLKTHEKNHVCSFCDEKFPSLNLLNDHLKKKHIKNVYMCNKCHDVFSSIWRLKVHSRRKHAESNERYKCIYCQMEIRYKTSLKRHLNAQHNDKMEEWNSPKAIADMMINAEIDLPSSQDCQDLMAANVTFPLSDILQTAAVDVMDTEENTNTDPQDPGIDQSSNTNLAATFAPEDVTESSTPQEITFGLNNLPGPESVTQLVSVEGDYLSVPVTVICDKPLPSLNISDPQNSVAINQGTTLAYPVVLPEGCVLTLDNNLVAKQPTEEASTLINVNDFQAISGATTSALVLTAEDDNDSSPQLQNHVLYYIVDDSVSDV